jgi:hypothetical protein
VMTVQSYENVFEKTMTWRIDVAQQSVKARNARTNCRSCAIRIRAEQEDGNVKCSR